jgi:hypothetical protein
MVEQVQSSNASDSNEEEKENPKYVNISKKPIKTSKHAEEPNKAQKVQEAQVAQ